MTPDDEVRAQELRAAAACIEKAIDHLAGLAAHIASPAEAETYERCIEGLTREAAHIERMIPREPGPLDSPHPLGVARTLDTYNTIAANGRQKVS